jgi:DNA (cytosine-5)-methyltransferase 1
MDCPKITHLSLCSGYGGIDLGLRRCISNLRTVAYAEIEAFACELLLARMEAGQLDAAPIWTDLKRFPWQKFRGLVDVLSGGYPCQPFSSAGKRLGGEDPRHLWPFISSGIRLLQPRICFFENVEGHITQGLHHVLSDLGGLGYRTTWGIFSARECGAPHQRKRVFILAHRKNTRLEGYRRLEQGNLRDDAWPTGPSQPQHEWEPPRVVANAVSTRWSSSAGKPSRVGGTECEEESGKSQLGTTSQAADSSGPAGAMGDAAQLLRNGSNDNAGIGNRCKAVSKFGDADWNARESVRQTEPTVGGNADGTAHRLDDAELYVTSDNRIDELRLLGNGVVPATAALAFQTLTARLL